MSKETFLAERYFPGNKKEERVRSTAPTHVEARKLPSSKGEKRGLLPSKMARLLSAIRNARGARKAVYHHSLQDCYLLLGWQEVQEKLYTVIYVARLPSTTRGGKRGKRGCLLSYRLQDCYLLLGLQEVQERLSTIIACKITSCC